VGGKEGGLEAVADELYGLPMAEFTAARDRHAAAARQAGNRELANEIKKLRRPTAGAWLTNQLVRQRGDEVAALLGVGAALRDAQARLATGDLRRLAQQAQQVVTTLGREARVLAKDAGQRVGESAVRELEETLHAALADPAASDAVRSGRLVSALSYAGFGAVDSVDPVESVDTAASPSLDAAQEQAAARQAAAELADARREASARQRLLEQARQQQDRLEQQVHELSEQLDRLRGEAAEAAAMVRDATRTYQDAERRLARAEAPSDGA
jgi:hypothetical protein